MHEWHRHEHLAVCMSEDDLMIIPGSLGYRHGGMKSCQGRVRINTEPEYINPLNVPPATGTVKRKYEYNRKLQ